MDSPAVLRLGGQQESRPAMFQARFAVIAPVVLVSALAAPASAALVTVGPGGTASGFQFAEVADAIAFASAGDTIDVQARAVDGARHSYAGFDLGLAQQGVSMEWGNSPGIIEVGGNMRVGPNADILFELGGTDNSQALSSGRVQYDTVFVTGNFRLEGMLNLVNFNGFAPALGHSFELVATSGSVTWTGAFDLHFTAPALASGLSWQFSVGTGTLGGQSIFASVVPAPGAIALIGVAGLAAARRRR